MNKANPTESLNASIAMLEQKRAAEFQSLKSHLRSTGESLKPANLLRSAVKDVAHSSQLKSILIKTAVAVAAGYVAKRLITRQRKTEKNNNLMGNVLQYGISFLASNRNKLLKTAGIYVANSLINSIKNRRQKRHHSNGIEHITY